MALTVLYVPDSLGVAGLHGAITFWNVHVGAQVAAGSLFVVSIRCS